MAATDLILTVRGKLAGPSWGILYLEEQRKKFSFGHAVNNIGAAARDEDEAGGDSCHLDLGSITVKAKGLGDLSQPTKLHTHRRVTLEHELNTLTPGGESWGRGRGNERGRAAVAASRG